MQNKEVTLLKGNEAIAHAAVRCGCDAFFGYPITPQTEIIETLSMLKPWETTGMVVLQAESEVASINMVYGAAGAGKRAFTTSSSPGIALMQEGISYMAGAEVPGVFVNVMRGGPGLGTIQPSQGDYFQATRGGGNGDYQVIVLAPSSVQEMADFMELAFTLAFRYRNPAMILADGIIGQMMEKVVLPAQKARRTEEEILEECPWASTGHMSSWHSEVRPASPRKVWKRLARRASRWDFSAPLRYGPSPHNRLRRWPKARKAFSWQRLTPDRWYRMCGWHSTDRYPWNTSGDWEE